MFETISTLGTTALACGFFHQLMKENSGLSPESRAVKKAATELSTKVPLHTEKNTLVSRLWALAEECGEADWNGYEAVPLSLLAIKQAEEFIRAWPFDNDLPDYAPEPDGSINLEWIYTKNRRAVVSLDGGTRLAFAWLDGADKGRGVCVFQGGQVPRKIVDAVRDIRER